MDLKSTFLLRPSESFQMNTQPALVAFFAVTMILSCTGCGCINGPRTFHASLREVDHSVLTTATAGDQRPTPSIEVVQGNPNKVLDSIGWVVGIPRRIILWDRRVDSHQVQPETMAEVATYAKINELDGICVRVNQYDPADEWKRLTKNDQISPGWRYTVGALSLVGYTLLPGRIIGIDNYNPYTNSVYVYSDVPALAMEAAAYAKDVRQRELPGTYAAVNSLPIISVWHETINTQDTLDYLQTHGTYEDQREGLAILYPNYGASVGGAFGSLFGFTGVFEIGGAVVGHVSGWHKATQVDPENIDTVQLKNDSPADNSEARTDLSHETLVVGNSK
jgi:hypothetical protein